MEIPVQDQSARLRPLAVLAAIGVLTVIAVGAYVTSRATAPQLASRPMADATIHRVIATVVGLVCLWMAYRQARAELPPLASMTALAVFVVTGCIGWMGGHVVLHATLAPLAFASFVVVAVATSPGWNQAPEFVDAQATPLLRPLAFAAPALLLLQTALGAMYRHKVTGILPHIGFALIVTLVTLAGAMIVLQHYPKHGALRPAAIWLMCALGAQVVLGFTALTIEILERGNSLALARIISTALHVVVGSLTLAASLVFAIQVQRHVRRLVPARPAAATAIGQATSQL